MNKYRSHNCNELRRKNVGEDVILAGWINKKRDHGNLLFIDLRDSTSLLQCVVDNSSEIFNELSKIKNEDVIKVNGQITKSAIPTDLVWETSPNGQRRPTMLPGTSYNGQTRKSLRPKKVVF